MEDRDARNMFSEALLEGLAEVFAHIARTPEYKVVILTGDVSSTLAKRAAGDDAWDTPGVVDVSNQLQVVVRR